MKLAEARNAVRKPGTVKVLLLFSCLGPDRMFELKRIEEIMQREVIRGYLPERIPNRGRTERRRFTPSETSRRSIARISATCVSNLLPGCLARRRLLDGAPLSSTVVSPVDG